MLISGSCHAQNKANNSIVDFMWENDGKKVGGGSCYEFVVRALETKYCDFDKDYYLNTDSMRAHQVSTDSIMIGDIIIMRDIVMNDSSSIKSHIGIVLSRLEDGSILYMSQNVGRKNDKYKYVYYVDGVTLVYKKSKVVADILDMGNILSGEVFTFRF